MRIEPNKERGTVPLLRSPMTLEFLDFPLARESSNHPDGARYATVCP